jgi:3-oxoacyl-[acyl-carrier protein] reductase
MAHSLQGKTALVTGGSRGIGRAITHRLVDAGATVVFSYARDADATAEVERACTGRAYAVRADQGDPGEMERLFGYVEERLGGLDILVLNAATNPLGAISEVTEEDFDRVMAVNAKGPFFAIKHASTRLRDGGRIIGVSTLNTVLPAPNIALYAASKAALERFVMVAARELGPRGITANIVSPGATDTDMLRSANSAAAIEQAVAFTALGRIGEPADIAAVVGFLAGPDAGWVTGQNLRATGGLVF